MSKENKFLIKAKQVINDYRSLLEKLRLWLDNTATTIGNALEFAKDNGKKEKEDR